MIDNLQALVAVVEAQSLTKASARLYVTQSAVSRRLQQLEETPGASLFDRAQRPPAPTAMGLRVYEHPISAGSPMRCNACIPRMKLRPASVLAKLDISVLVTPGATALTRMPRGPSAEAKGFTSAPTAPFVAE